MTGTCGFDCKAIPGDLAIEKQRKPKKSQFLDILDRFLFKYVALAEVLATREANLTMTIPFNSQWFSSMLSSGGAPLVSTIVFTILSFDLTTLLVFPAKRSFNVSVAVAEGGMLQVKLWNDLGVQLWWRYALVAKWNNA